EFRRVLFRSSRRDPVAQGLGGRGGDGVVRLRGAVFGGLAAVDHQRGVEARDGVEHGPQPGHALLVLGGRVGGGEECETHRIAPGGRGGTGPLRGGGHGGGRSEQAAGGRGGPRGGEGGAAGEA